MKFENFLPIFAPAPAGLVIAIRLYQEIMVAVGSSGNTAWQFIAGFAALIGCIGMIGGEMYAYKQAGIALAERQIGAAFSAFVAALVCSGLVIWAIGTSENTRPLISAVVVAIAIYIVLAIRDFLGRKTSIVQTAKNDEKAQREHEEKMEKMRTSQVLADARKAKAQVFTGNPAPVRANTNIANTNSRALGADKIAEIRSFQAANPTATVRDVAAACGVSNASVQKYGKAVQP